MHKMMLFMVNPFKRCWRQHHDHAGQDWFPIPLDNAGSGNGFPKGLPGDDAPEARNGSLARLCRYARTAVTNLLRPGRLPAGADRGPAFGAECDRAA